MENNWCIKLNDENRDVVLGYLNEKYNKTFNGNAIYYGINNINEADYWHGKSSSLREITTEQFIEMIQYEGYKVMYNPIIKKHEYVCKPAYSGIKFNSSSNILQTSKNNPPINNEFGVVFGSDNKFHKSELDNDTISVVPSSGMQDIPKSEQLLKQAAELRKIKNADYSRGNVNPHDFFYSTAKKKGIRPVDVWGVLNEKHQAAFDSFIKNGTESEPIEGRVIDMINYLLIFIDNKDNPEFFKNFGNGK